MPRRPRSRPSTAAARPERSPPCDVRTRPPPYPLRAELTGICPPLPPGASRTVAGPPRTYGARSMTVASSAVDDPLSAARHALERGAWSEARGRYAAIAEAEDDPGAWEGLAWAS